MASPIELDMSSPDVSPARVEGASILDAGPADVHATSAGATVTVTATESTAAEAALTDHTVGEPGPAHCV